VSHGRQIGLIVAAERVVAAGRATFPQANRKCAVRGSYEACLAVCGERFGHCVTVLLARRNGTSGWYA
jgi:deoxycytidylate deaminase